MSPLSNAEHTMRVEYRAIAHPHAAERIRTAYDIIMHATPRPIDAAIKLDHRAPPGM